MTLVLDSGGLSHLAERSPRALAVIRELRAAGLWPPVVASPVLVECLTGHPGRDAATNRLLTTCALRTELPAAMARRGARLRFSARRGSAVDAIVVASAEPSGVVLTSDGADPRALAEVATGVAVHPV